MVTDKRAKDITGKQRGAVMVEFAVTISLFMILVLAIFEFVLMVMALSRANEATREIARHAIVRVPDSIGAPPGSGGIVGDDFFETRARQQLRAEWIENVQVSYDALPDTADRYNVTVSLDGARYSLFVPTLLRLSPDIAVPSFATSRISENLNTSP